VIANLQKPTFKNGFGLRTDMSIKKGGRCSDNSSSTWALHALERPPTARQFELQDQKEENKASAASLHFKALNARLKLFLRLEQPKPS